PGLAPVADARPRDAPRRRRRPGRREDPGREVVGPLPRRLRAARPRDHRSGRTGPLVVEPRTLHLQTRAPADLPARRFLADLTEENADAVFSLCHGRFQNLRREGLPAPHGRAQEPRPPQARAGPASREEPRVVQERARRGAGGAARRPHPGGDRRARGRAPADARRPARDRARHARRRGRAVERGAVSRRRARDLSGPGTALPFALGDVDDELGVDTTRGVIFDMDGVLIDSGAHHRAAWRALLDELGVAPARPDYWRL